MKNAINFNLNGRNSKGLIEFFHYLIHPFKKKTCYFYCSTTIECALEFIISTKVTIDKASFTRKDLIFNAKAMNDDTNEIYKRHTYDKGCFTANCPIHMSEKTIWSMFIKAGDFIEKKAVGCQLPMTSVSDDLYNTKRIVYEQLHEAIWAVIGKAEVLGASEDTPISLYTDIRKVIAHRRSRYHNITLSTEFPFSYSNEITTTTRELKVFDKLLYYTNSSISSLIKNNKKFVRSYGDDMFSSLIFDQESSTNMIRSESIRILNESIDNASIDFLNCVKSFRKGTNKTSKSYIKAEETLKTICSSMNSINNVK